ncbi:MAG: hypothetical protein DI603_15330 [Roseateles depolymerans]|uniref:Photosynthesis system II assembly factor Ycf48/Hcf136-like domain-containing protein n=1 Tax=Roseateles depolymerans TaxID=76731 RepID=A0A2W5DE03_9BURK|nr:MAG: hypothetical protein DI603_15330 [Roseateles depolymerans]
MAAVAGLAQRQAPHPDMLRSVRPWDIGRPDWWLYPRELNAFKRRVIAGELGTVFALPGSTHLWVAGQRGLILHSEDGGRHWEQQYPEPPPPGGPPALAALIEGLLPSAQAADAAKTPPQQQVARPVDAGDDPKAIANREQRLKAAQAASAYPAQPEGTGLTPTIQQQAASAAGRAPPPPAPRRLDPGGADAPPSGSTAPIVTLTGLHFVDDQRGWAVGQAEDDRAVLLRTENGGRNWQRLALPVRRASALAIAFDRDGRQGWLGGDNGLLLLSTDAGNTWRDAGPTNSLTWHQLLVAPAGGTAWALGHTPTGRQVWMRSPDHADGVRLAGLPDGFGVCGAVHPGTGRLWLAAQSGELLEINGAAPSGWPRLSGRAAAKPPDAAGPTPADGCLLGFAPDGRRLWLADGFGTLWHLDLPGEQGWQREPLSGVRAVAGAAGQAWAVGAGGALWQHDGSGWQAQSTGALGSLTQVAFAADGRQGWAIGSGGLALVSNDGGVNWAPAYQTPPGVALNRLAVAADGSQVMLANASTLLDSRDGGRHWRRSDFDAPLSGPALDARLETGWLLLPREQLMRTTDRGVTWAAQASAPNGGLSALALSPAGSQLWAVGDAVHLRSGPVAAWQAIKLPPATPEGSSTRPNALAALDDGQAWLTTTDGRILYRAPGGAGFDRTWTGNDRPLHALRMLPDGLRGWAAGMGGLMLATLDGGKTWSPQVSGTAQTLRGLEVSADGQKLWAVGDAATLRRSLDGGRNWSEVGVYHRTWAPWAYAALLLLSAGLALLVLRVTPRGVVMAGDPERAEGASTTLASDQPVIDKAHDLLGYRSAVEALSSFIRNEATEPRVTLAVSGEWGSGKSSIMRMLQTELQRAGFRTAWYNAWHQQQEGRPLTALFNSIRQQAVPRWFEQPLAALRVRSRLIWARGGVYRGASLLAALGLAVLIGDLLRAEGLGSGERLAANFRHYVLGQQTLVLDRSSLAALNPFKEAHDRASTGDVNLAEVARACAAPAKAALLPNPPLNAGAFCAVATQLLPSTEWRNFPSLACRVKPLPGTPAEAACLFNGSDALQQLLKERLALSQAEQALVVKSAQVVPPPPLFSWLHGSLASGMAGLVLLIFTKGVSVYGLQLLAPLKTLLGAKLADESSKESAGTVERYRAEFCLLCQALDGRLVVFVDDLDRCTPETVNRTLELTNYLVDVGRCFVVIGAALERVKKCVRPPVFMARPDSPEGQKEALDYANDYLRKLVHVELPVPGRGEQLHRLLEPRPEARTQSREQARRLLLERAGLAAATLAFLGALWMALGLGARLHDQGGTDVPELKPAPPAASAVPLPAPAPASAAANAAARAETAASGAAARAWVGPDTGPVGLADPGEDERWPRSAWVALSASAGVLAAALGWKRLRRYRTALAVALGGALRERDSARFLGTLRLWSRLVIAHDPTPRQIKRFYNRARLLAAFEAGADKDVDEAQLVALAALDQAQPGLLARLGAATALGDQLLADYLLGETRLDGQPPDPQLQQLWQQHLTLLGRMPSVHELRRFLERVAGLEVR